MDCFNIHAALTKASANLSIGVIAGAGLDSSILVGAPGEEATKMN